MTDIFNPKESALFVWFIIIMIFVISYAKSRKSALSVFRALFSKKLNIVYGFAIGYVFFCCWLLNLVNLWDTSLVKDTIFWLLFVSSMMMYHVGRKKDLPKFFKDTILSILKLTVLLEFLVGLNTLSFWMEFISIPITTFIVIVLVVSQEKSKDLRVTNLLNGLIILIGLCFFCSSFYQLFQNHQNLLKFSTLKQLLLPQLLTLLFLPFLLCLGLYIQYEDIYIGLQRSIRSPGLLNYAKWNALLYFNWNIKGLHRWKKQAMLKSLQSQSEVIRSIELILEQQKMEKNPPLIPSNFGWSPYVAKNFMIDSELPTGNYFSDLGDEWAAMSHKKKLEEGFMSSDLTYSLKGTMYIAKILELTLRVFDSSIVSNCKYQLADYTTILYFKAVNKEIPENIKKAIIKGENLNVRTGNITLNIKKDQWKNQSKGYSLNIRIVYNN